MEGDAACRRNACPGLVSMTERLYDMLGTAGSVDSGEFGVRAIVVAGDGIIEHEA